MFGLCYTGYIVKKAAWGLFLIPYRPLSILNSRKGIHEHWLEEGAVDNILFYEVCSDLCHTAEMYWAAMSYNIIHADFKQKICTFIN